MKLPKGLAFPRLLVFCVFLFFWAAAPSLYAEPAREISSSNTAPERGSASSQTGPAQVPGLNVIQFPKIQEEADPAQLSFPPASPLFPAGPRYAVIPERLRPGEPFAVAYCGDFSGPESEDFQAALLDSEGRRVAKANLFSFARDSGGREVKAALLAVPSTVSPGPMLVRIETRDGTIKDLPLFAEERDFASEFIPLDNKNTEIRTTPDPRKTEESEKLWAIINKTGVDVYASGNFLPPVASTRRTSFFGDRRVFQYVDGSSGTAIHAGVDYGVPEGTEVRSCAKGKIVLARSRIVTGGSIIVEHLPGVYSLYYHLSEIKVEEGSLAEAGTLLGLSGNTGLSTGPHLHWEIRASGENTDPDAFVSRPVLDKDEILSKLKEY